MEGYRRGDPWDLPDDPRKRRERSSEIAEDICNQFDEITHEFLEKVLRKVIEERERNQVKIHVEEIEDLNTHGVRVYSLISGMDMYRAEVRASGIEIWERDNYDSGEPLDERHPAWTNLRDALLTK